MRISSERRTPVSKNPTGKRQKTRWSPLKVFVARASRCGGTLAPAAIKPEARAKPQIPCGVWRNPRTGWTKCVSIADTGATRSVSHPDAFPDQQIVPSRGSQEGSSFTDASGGDVPMLGERRMRAIGADGSEREICHQVAEVAVPLTSVGEMCDEYKIVTFGRRGWSAWDRRTGATEYHPRVSGIFCFEEWIPPAATPGFQRPE